MGKREDVREIIKQAQSKSLDSEYKCFIIDECHAISNTGWQAFLKLIEEPPAKSIFLFCTTNPERIPKTILSRVQRYDFNRISNDGIVNRLRYICDRECSPEKGYIVRLEALEYISKLSDGGMRTAITFLDKCLAYSRELTLENVVTALGTVDYEVMTSLTDAIVSYNVEETIDVIEKLYLSGKDLKQFIRQYVNFLLDVNKWAINVPNDYLNIPMTDTMKKWLEGLSSNNLDLILDLLSIIVKLNSSIKYSQSVKADVEAELLLFMERSETLSDWTKRLD